MDYRETLQSFDFTFGPLKLQHGTPVLTVEALQHLQQLSPQLQSLHLCKHLADEIDPDKPICSCGYRGGIFVADQETLLCEMGSTLIEGEEGLRAPRLPRLAEVAASWRIAMMPQTEALLLEAVAILAQTDSVAARTFINKLQTRDFEHGF